jgi:hypothetical protein
VATLFVRLARKSEPLDEDGGDEMLIEHKAVAGSLKALDRLAGEAKLPPLSQFISEDPENVYDSVDDEDEAEELLAKLPPVRWFEPSAAIPTITALLARLSKNDEVPGIKNAAKTTKELRDFETILKYCTAKRAQFRFYREF